MKDEGLQMCGVKHAGLQEAWCEECKKSCVKHAGLQDEWCEAKLASRTCGVKSAGLQDAWCEARKTCGRRRRRIAAVSGRDLLRIAQDKG